MDDSFRKIYFDAYDNAIKAIEDRFNQQDFKNYAALQEQILHAIKGERYEEHLEIIKTVYGDDLNYILLETQLELLPETFENGVSDVKELLDAFRNLDKAKRTLLSGVMKVVKLIIVLSATNAVSERSFSALKRVKTYLRSTTSANRLNHLMMLHVHKDNTDRLDNEDICSDFI